MKYILFKFYNYLTKEKYNTIYSSNNKFKDRKLQINNSNDYDVIYTLNMDGSIYEEYTKKDNKCVIM